MKGAFALIDEYTERAKSSQYDKPHDLGYVLLGAIDEHLAAEGRRMLSHEQQRHVRAALIAAGNAQS